MKSLKMILGVTVVSCLALPVFAGTSQVGSANMADLKTKTVCYVTNVNVERSPKDVIDTSTFKDDEFMDKKIIFDKHQISISLEETPSYTRVYSTMTSLETGKSVSISASVVRDLSINLEKEDSQFVSLVCDRTDLK
jgi:hypothetical protein